MSSNSRFNEFIRILLDFETEYNRDGSVRVERDPHDPGGTTKFGIDQRSHPGVNIAALTRADAESIYWRDWLRMPCDELPCPLGELLMDIVQNGGPGAVWIQEAIGVKADGHIGPVTLAAAQAMSGSVTPMRAAVNYVCDQRAERFKRLPGAARYLKGWLARNETLRKWALSKVQAA